MSKAPATSVRIGMAADHGGFALKEYLAELLRDEDRALVDFGAFRELHGDDYPDYVLPLARAVGAGHLDRGLAVCGSGVGASIVANRIKGVRAAVCHDPYSARQGVEHDRMNVLCLGGRVVGTQLAAEVVARFLDARFSSEERHLRRLEKVARASRS